MRVETARVAHLGTRQNAKSVCRREPLPSFGSRRMGYFVLTTVCTLTYLGYVPIPKQVLIGACVIYVLYDAFKR
jgi:hypothetical protein